MTKDKDTAEMASVVDATIEPQEKTTNEAATTDPKQNVAAATEQEENKKKPKKGFFTKLFNMMFGEDEERESQKPTLVSVEIIKGGGDDQSVKGWGAWMNGLIEEGKTMLGNFTQKIIMDPIDRLAGRDKKGSNVTNPLGDDATNPPLGDGPKKIHPGDKVNNFEDLTKGVLDTLAKSDSFDSKDSSIHTANHVENQKSADITR